MPTQDEPTNASLSPSPKSERGPEGEVPRPRGGRRPGAGAPKGNTNNLKHGFDSPTITRAALIITTFPEVHRLFQAIINTTDRSRYRRLLAAHRRNARTQDRGTSIPLQDSIKTDIAFALIQRLDRIQEAEEFFSKHAAQSSQSNPAQRLYERIKRTHPDLYHAWFGTEENRS